MGRVLAILSLLLMSSAARAEPPASDAPDTEVARRHYERGSERYLAGDYAAAIDEFERALRVNAAPALHYNIARSAERLERWSRAVEAYRAFLRLAPGAPEREDVRARITELEVRVVAERAEQARRDAVRRGRRGWQAGAGAAAGGAALLIVGGALIGVSNHADDELTDRFRTPGRWDTDAVALEDRARSARVGGLVLVSAGAAVALAGLIAVGVGRRDEVHARAR